MPPMPPNAVPVHELENKLEQVSMDAGSKQSSSANDKPMSGMQQQQSSQASHDMTGGHVPGIHNPYSSSSQYAAMGIGYNYGGPAATPVNAFVGMPGPGGPVLGTSPQPPPPKPPQPTGGPLQQGAGGGLYGTPHSVQSSGTVPGTSVGGNSNDTAPSTNAGIPPGMPNPGMAYGNPAVYYGQQPPFHIGHNPGGIGYNYYGAQFGGVQGFGYGLGQNNAYGHGPYHDDQGVAGSNTHQQQGSTGGYQQQPKNNSGGYRGGRNSHSHHNNSNQYQQSHQYNPQQQHHQGGYGGQPYGMGYHGDHFGQRNAYGGMQDPYGMQPQPQGAGNYGTGFQSDDQYKGKNKGNRGGGLQHFQQPQGPPQQLSGQQPFGLQAQGGSDSNQQAGAGGWSNQHSSGWSGGTSGWQQK